MGLNIDNVQGPALLTKYFNLIGKYHVLDVNEEKDLTIAYFNTRDPKLLDKLTQHNLRLVVKIAREFRVQGDLLDLIQEGNYGLVQGIQKFQPSRGVPLANHCANWIRARIYRFIMNNSRMVKVGTTQAQRKLFYNLDKEVTKLAAKGIEFNDQDLAEGLEVKAKDVAEMRQRLLPETRLDSPIHENGTTRLDLIESDGCCPEENFGTHETNNYLRGRFNQFRKTLNQMETEIFNCRLLADEPETLDSIGLRFNLTRERIRQVESKIKNKLKTFLNSEKF